MDSRELPIKGSTISKRRSASARHEAKKLPRESKELEETTKLLQSGTSILRLLLHKSKVVDGRHLSILKT
jgi:hypothetical protein